MNLVGEGSDYRAGKMNWPHKQCQGLPQDNLYGMATVLAHAAGTDVSDSTPLSRMISFQSTQDRTDGNARAELSSTQ